VYPHLGTQGFLALVLYCLGFSDQAMARSNAAITEARRSAHLPSWATSLALGAKLLSLGEDSATLEEQADQLVAVTIEQGLPHWGAQGTIYRGWVRGKCGDVTEGISLLRIGLAAYRATGSEAWMPHHIALLARACEIAGQIEEAMTLWDEALGIVDRTGERWFVAELNRHKGELLLRQGHPDVAEELYHTALSIAREQEAKLWELRATVSLVRLRHDEGRRGKPATSWRQSTAGSPRVSTPLTSGRQRHCWTGSTLSSLLLWPLQLRRERRSGTGTSQRSGSASRRAVRWGRADVLSSCSS